jgi:SAM-dependent methyltransferase
MKEHIGFEYMNRGEKTPFETFLQYTNEKEKSAEVLAKFLEPSLSGGGKRLLDIGAGNGVYLESALEKAKSPHDTDITLLEPSIDFAKSLRESLSLRPILESADIANTSFDNFYGNHKNAFDVALASHLPFTKDALATTLNNMLDVIREHGRLIVVLRGKDDAYEFRTIFKTHLNETEDYSALIIDDALRIFEELANERSLRISHADALSKLKIPMEKNMEDTIRIIEFYLNEQWDNIPENTRNSVLVYLGKRKGLLRQIDGFAVVDKNPLS